jgi:hypothetical protein
VVSVNVTLKLNSASTILSYSGCVVYGTIIEDNVLKLFTVVVYPHLMVLLPSCVIKHHYCGKNHRMAVNNLDKKLYNIGPRWQT